MTLNDLERQNRVLMDFLAISNCDTSLYHSQGGATQRYAMADVYIYMAVSKMSNVIDFEHLQTVLLSVAYSRIKTFFSIAVRRYILRRQNYKC